MAPVRTTEKANSKRKKSTSTAAAKNTTKPVPKKARKKAAESEGSDGEGLQTTEEGTEIDWTGDNHALTWQLIRIIENTPEIKQGLFPPPGAHVSTSKGGGKAKSDHHWAICELLFAHSENPAYKAGFDAILTSKAPAKERKIWTNKIKNRIASMVKITQNGIKRLGATGEGLRKEEVWADSTMRTIWDAIEFKTPWFSDVRDLIAYRPNIIPVGIGNSQFAIDTSVLIPEKDEDDPENWSDSHPDLDIQYDLDDDHEGDEQGEDKGEDKSISDAAQEEPPATIAGREVQNFREIANNSTTTQ